MAEPSTALEPPATPMEQPVVESVHPAPATAEHDYDRYTNQVLPPELEETDALESPPDYELHGASREMLAGTTDVTDDGRITVNLDTKVAQVFAKLIQIPAEEDDLAPPPVYSPQAPWNLPLNIVVQVVGSRGDVQPFIALGNELQRSGHRVRLATHNVFKNFVQSHGLEFFPVGGDPAELMAYMVKNPGLIPNMKTLREGEIARKRKMVAQMLDGCWKSCIEPDPDSQKPFVANAVIANPPSFAHIHCAQALGVPLHLVFTMPWSPTRAFPHPLANLQNTTTDPKLANYLSYGLVQCLTWQGLGDVINDWRKTIDLEPVPTSEGPFLAETLKIPHTYCWSPALVPKPKDWPDHIDVSGFLFREQPDYTPPAELEAFLHAGSEPVYIGFGSIVVDDPAALMLTVKEAVKLSGVRAIVSKGWSELGSDTASDDIFFLGDCPHEWLFKQVSAVVHHGGAGTTAAGLVNGKPTTIIPFFGDQPFWGDMVAAAGAGPPPINHKKLTAENLGAAIRFCLTPEAGTGARKLAEMMRAEKGVEAIAASFHRHLSQEILRCDLQPSLPATYTCTKGKKTLKMSGPAAEVLIKHGKIKMKDLNLYGARTMRIEHRRWDPFTSATSVGLSMSYDFLSATNDIWYAPLKMRRQKATSDDGGEGPSNQGAMAAKMVGASAMSIPKIYGALLKGFIVDTPLAIAEGLRATPRLYGERVEEHAQIVDWKSGAVVAGREFAGGMAQGLTDLVVQPMRGAKEEGALGLVAGIGKGLVGTLTKTGAAAVGLAAYPALGIYKSLHSATHKSTRKSISRARRVHDAYVMRSEAGRADEDAVIAAFDAAFADQTSPKVRRHLSRRSADEEAE